MPLARLQSTLSPRYEFDRELGRGGMATVYLALDRKHRRRVAVKVLDPGVAAALGPERFLREIGIAARLSHPHILPLHDSGQAGGTLYYVMPYVEGESLRQRLAREERLPLEDALRITRELADALGYAHAQGVIHRDVKPENILLSVSGGHALLADFGIAHAVGRVGEERLTDSGLQPGTAAYASPEQISGSREVDARSDLYSLGCVLAEMVAKGAPEWLAAVVRRATARQPDDRFQTAEEFAAALTGRELPRRWMWIGAGAVCLALIVASRALLPHPGADLDARRVLVAGFENRTGDSTLDVVGNIAADYLARGLAATRLLHAVYDARAEAAEGRSATPLGAAAGRRTARGLGAGTVVLGSYYRESDTLHFETQLLDAASGKLMLSTEPVAGPVDRPTQVVERLRQHVMGAFGSVFGADFEAWEAKSLPPTYEAYQEMLEGHKAFWNYDYGGAAEHFRRAAALDSSFTSAKTNLAVVSALGGGCAITDSVARQLRVVRDRLPPLDRGQLQWAAAWCHHDFDAALDAGRTVLATTPRSVEFAILMSVTALELLRPREALAIFDALDAKSGWLTGHQRTYQGEFLDLAYHGLGDHAKELEAARRGLRADPGQWHLQQDELVALAALGRVSELNHRVDELLAHPPDWAYAPGLLMQLLGLELRAHGQPEAGRAMLERAVAWYQTRPLNESGRTWDVFALRRLLSVYYYAGRWSETQALYGGLVARDSGNVVARWMLGILAARQGDTTEAHRIDRWLATVPPGNYAGADLAYARAQIAALLGDREGAVRLLQESFDHGLNGRMYIHLDPDLESLRDYPPYRELMKLDTR